MLTVQSVWPGLLTLLAAITLSACGGGGGGGGGGNSSGGGGGDGNALPITDFIVASGANPNTLRFSWRTDDSESSVVGADMMGRANGSNVDHYRLESNPDGNSGFTVLDGADQIDATEVEIPISVHLIDWQNALYRVVAVDANGNDVGSSDDLPLMGNVDSAEAVGYFKGSNTEGGFTSVAGPLFGDAFGSAVVSSADSNGVDFSADGNWLVVSAPEERSGSSTINGDESDNSAIEAGAVYVFRRDGFEWRQDVYLKASNAEEADLFGSSVAISGDGDRVAVGAIEESSRSTGIDGDQENNQGGSIGAAYVFIRTATGWEQEAYVKADIVDVTRFGGEVALSKGGDRLAVYGTANDGSGKTVWIFHNDGNGWAPETTLNSVDCITAAPARFEFSNDGSVLAMAGRNFNFGVTGCVRVFERSGTAWNVQQTFVPDELEDGDRILGLDLSGDGTVLAVGAVNEDSSATGVNGDETDNSLKDSGAAYVFVREGGRGPSRRISRRRIRA